MDFMSPWQQREPPSRSQHMVAFGSRGTRLGNDGDEPYSAAWRFFGVAGAMKMVFCNVPGTIGLTKMNV